MKFRALAPFALIWFVLMALPAVAQVSPQFQACNRNAKTQLAMDICAGNEAALRMKQMDYIYNELMSRAARQPGAVAKIRASQKAWTAYADAYIEALYPAKDKQLSYGSVYPMEVALARSGLVQQHIADLKVLLTQYEQQK
jgi:uncharacterized protein YecT (DUF1311 family)